MQFFKFRINMNNDENFNLYEKALKENPLYPAEECYIQVTKLIDDSIIRLYDSIDNYIFQDIDYSKVVSNMPQWVADAGISPELSCSKDWYEKLRGNTTHPIFGKFLYHYDLWSRLQPYRID